MAAKYGTKDTWLRRLFFSRPSGQTADIAVRMLIVVPVVAVQTGGIGIAHIETVAIRVEGSVKHHLHHHSSNTLQVE